MKKLLCLLFLLPLLAKPAQAAPPESAPSESAYDRVIRTGTLRCGYSPWPPYFAQNPNTGEITGLSKDLSDLVARFMGVKIQYVQITLGQQVQDLKSGKFDAICGDGPWVVSTIKYLDYTHPYFYAGAYAFGRSGETRVKNLADLNRKGLRFVGVDGDVSSDLVFNLYPQAVMHSLPSTTDPAQLILNVTTNKADIVLTDPLTAADFTKNNPGQLKRLSADPVLVYGGGFSVSKGETNLLNTLNAAIDMVNNAGLSQQAIRRIDPAGEYFLPVAKPYGAPAK